MQSRHWGRFDRVESGDSATPALAAGQADAKGFVEDSALNVLLRNAYINRDYSDGRQDSSEWGQAAIANFSSGFTQGTVGFGVDPLRGLRPCASDSTRRRSGNGGIDFFIKDSNGNPVARRGQGRRRARRPACPEHRAGLRRTWAPLAAQCSTMTMSRLLPESLSPTGTLEPVDDQQNGSHRVIGNIEGQSVIGIWSQSRIGT